MRNFCKFWVEVASWRMACKGGSSYGRTVGNLVAADSPQDRAAERVEKEVNRLIDEATTAHRSAIDRLTRELLSANGALDAARERIRGLERTAERHHGASVVMGTEMALREQLNSLSLDRNLHRARADKAEAKLATIKQAAAFDTEGELAALRDVEDFGRSKRAQTLAKMLRRIQDAVFGSRSGPGATVASKPADTNAGVYRGTLTQPAQPVLTPVPLRASPLTACAPDCGVCRREREQLKWQNFNATYGRSGYVYRPDYPSDLP